MVFSPIYFVVTKIIVIFALGFTNVKSGDKVSKKK